MTNPFIATTLSPPYIAVIFTSQRTSGDQGYADMADHILKLAAGQPGFLGIESVRDADGRGITVSYWESEKAITDWKANTEHLNAQEAGKQLWYSDYHVRIARVEREYSHP